MGALGAASGANVQCEAAALRLRCLAHAIQAWVASAFAPILNTTAPYCFRGKARSQLIDTAGHPVGEGSAAEPGINVCAPCEHALKFTPSQPRCSSTPTPTPAARPARQLQSSSFRRPVPPTHRHHHRKETRQLYCWPGGCSGAADVGGGMDTRTSESRMACRNVFCTPPPHGDGVDGEWGQMEWQGQEGWVVGADGTRGGGMGQGGEAWKSEQLCTGYKPPHTRTHTHKPFAAGRR